MSEATRPKLDYEAIADALYYDNHLLQALKDACRYEFNKMSKDRPTNLRTFLDSWALSAEEVPISATLHAALELAFPGGAYALILAKRIQCVVADGAPVAVLPERFFPDDPYSTRLGRVKIIVNVTPEGTMTVQVPDSIKIRNTGKGLAVADSSLEKALANTRSYGEFVITGLSLLSPRSRS